MFERVFAVIILVAGLLTLTMLYPVFAPATAVQSMFGETPSGAALAVIIPNWGILIGLMGALLIYGAINPPSRKLALVVAGASKVAFIALILMQGDRYLSGLGTAVIVDSIMIVLFAVYLIFGRPTKPA